MTTTTTITASPNSAAIDTPQIPPGKALLAAFASTFGWALDLFDLFILLYVAPIIGRMFFPSDTPTLSLAAVYASFAVALLVRPLGSAIFGAYADKHGRKRALMVSMVGVGISTALFGALPTIHQVGILAPILFLILRVIQGIFVGGIVASTHTIGTESISPRYRGLMSGLIGGAGAGMGALLASATYLVLSQIFPGEEFDVWGWRFMFFCGLLSTVFGLVMFRYLEETPVWQQLQQARKTKGPAVVVVSPLKRLFGREYRAVMLVNLLITFGGGATYYLACGYLPTLLNVVAKVPHTQTSQMLMYGSVATIVGALAFGYLSDLIGRKKTFMLLGVINLVSLPMMFLGVAESGSLTRTALYCVGIGFMGGAIIAPILIFLNERFATELRASGTGLSWNIGFALGGTMPTFVSLVSSSPAQIPMVLAMFAVGLSVIYLIGSVVIPETQGNFK
ncbi:MULTISPECIES: MFS transporter [unclassified Pseudomonas]|uniref:MFS transporter n=1 Tax=unclassified Pseudomonas TaxID=196821 RepID=UPI00029CF343|nr:MULTISPECIES: MFS transporter [unclassified Pseudomonas]AFY19815.1 major facilitator superfamily protein [Pseudomonas sp. UW4]PBJ04778.1 Proline/betaine transporter [Pseudomonas sp. ACN5]